MNEVIMLQEKLQCDALQRIAALKHLAVEVAAYGHCACDREAAPNEFCVYCVAMNLCSDMSADLSMNDRSNPYLFKQKPDSSL